MKTYLMTLMAGLSLMAAAETVEFKGETITYSGASEVKTLDNGDLVLVYTDASAVGTLVLPQLVKARVLAVGGGGAGGTVGVGTKDFGAGGGGAGGLYDKAIDLDAGSYTITVGAGGAKADSYVQSFVGENGGMTKLTLNPAADEESAGGYIVSAPGGGGGGVPKNNGVGESGGSGGGGSWHASKAVNPGSGTDGYGWAGGKPTDKKSGCGGGGGGAATTTAGRGGADGTAGAGRASDITGTSVVYATGGRGGNAKTPFAALDGATYGCGGDGASKPGKGGSGADGILVVRLSSFYTRKTVPEPQYADAFIWENGQTFVAIDPSTVLPTELRPGIASISGTTSIACSLEPAAADGSVQTNGLGRFSFSVSLKPEYVWEDGSKLPRTFYWRVKEPGTIGSASADVTKKVTWSEGTNATISIVAHTKPEARVDLPTVLFLGTYCSSHGLSKTTVQASLTTTALSAKLVDYWLYDSNGDVASGSLSHEQTAVVNANNPAGGAHCALTYFYQKLDEIRQNEELAKKYDYIIFEFDGSRIAQFYGTGNTKISGSLSNQEKQKMKAPYENEAEVAEFLKPFYANKKVILVVDNCYGNNNDKVDLPPNGVLYEPWSQDYWRPNTYEYSSGSWNLSFDAFKGMIGMFAPADYVASATTWNELGNVVSKSFQPKDASSEQTFYAGARYDIQTNYNNVNTLCDYIKSVLSAISYTAHVADDIHIDTGLALTASAGSWTTNELGLAESNTEWYPLTAEQLVPTGSGVKVALPGLTSEAWIKFTIDVTDVGGFLSGDGAEYNTTTGMLEKDPNNGPVRVWETPDGKDTVIVEDNAETTVAWTTPAYQITGTVLPSADDTTHGNIVLNGKQTDKIYAGEGASPEVVFKGDPGYVLDTLIVDGLEIDDLDSTTSSWIFENIGSDHDVQVKFKQFEMTTPTTGPTVHEYDGNPYAITVDNVSFVVKDEGGNVVETLDYEWYPVYSFTPDGEYSKDVGQVDVVLDSNGNPAPRTMYTRIAVLQPGYEEPIILDSWTGSNTVTITPRPLTVTFDDYVQTTDTRKENNFANTVSEDDLVEGDKVTVTGSQCTSYPAKGGHTTDSITADSGNVTINNKDGEDITSNYTITIVPGDYYYPDKQIKATAEGVEKVYDGLASTIEVTLVFPEKSADGTYKPTVDRVKAETGRDSVQNISTSGPVYTYSIDGGKTYQSEKPSYTDAGEYTINYKIEYTYTYQYWRSGWSAGWRDAKVTYDVCTGSAQVIIHPRPVTVTAESASKEYDGTALTDSDYTVSETTDVTGFVAGEGIDSLRMTSGSTITNPGSVANTIDEGGVTLKSNTKSSNYAITYVPGTLTVTGKLTEKPTPVEKYYDGTPSSITVEVTPSVPGTEYTIKYTTDPNDPDSWSENPKFTDVGEHEVFYIVEAEGYPPVTNSTTVLIKPREIVVTADDKSKIKGEPDPELTWTVDKNTEVPEGVATGIVPGEEELVRKLIGEDPSFDITRTGVGTEEGEQVTTGGSGYPITPSGDEYIGNYHIVYKPGELTIAAAVYSSNIYGLLKINSTAKNTIIPAPWKGYSPNGAPTEKIRADRLVKPRNLTAGDLLMVSDGAGKYTTWVLQKDATTGVGKWVPSATVLAPRNDLVEHDGNATVVRGHGLWLIRQKPVTTDGKAIPFYLNGQWTTGRDEVEVFGQKGAVSYVDDKGIGAAYKNEGYTMLADPDCTRPSEINKWTWNNVDVNDTVILNTDSNLPVYGMKLTKRGGTVLDGWYYWGGNGEYLQDLKSPTGVGFWYVRRAAAASTVSFPGAEPYAGEGENHPVWIVDHADAGDGKIYLAVEYTAKKNELTAEYVQKLFTAGAIRYLHVSARETQALGKAEMDKLTEADAVPVLALRQDDTATADLKKGIIWVTIDVPDGTHAADSTDGHGDTNGAGDLWRVVIGSK